MDYEETKVNEKVLEESQGEESVNQDAPEVDNEPLVNIGNLAYDEGGLHFTVEADGYELEGYFTVYDPANGDDMKLVSIDYGYNHPIIERQWDRIESALAEMAKERYEYLLSDEKRCSELVQSHAELLESKSGGKQSIVINAYGGPGAGKSTACLQIVEELKKAGYVAEYVQEYAKELVWDEKFDLLDGTQEHQFAILQEQMQRMDRLYGKVDFIVTDAPLLLNGVYNKELSPAYDKMLSSLNAQYKSFNFVVERDSDASKFEKEGRIHNLEESIKKDGHIKELLKEKGIYYGTYNHSTVEKIVNNAVKTLQRETSINQTPETLEQPNENETKPDETPGESGAKPVPEPEAKPKADYKAFAYMKNSDKPKVFFGNSQSKLINQMQEWNKTRTPGFTYDTCNIGTYNRETDKYENFQKFDVQSGKNISKIALHIPTGLSKEEFQETINYFKEQGARFNAINKKWYIEQEQKEAFKDYLQPSHKEKSPEESKKEEPVNPALEASEQPNGAVSEEPISQPMEEKIALHVPTGLSKEEFQETIKYFKEQGARFNAADKKWYIEPDKQEALKDYLQPFQKEKVLEEAPKEEPVNEVDAQEVMGQEEFEDIIKELDQKNEAFIENIDSEEISMLDMVANIDRQHVVELKNGEILTISENEMLQKAGLRNIEELTVDKAIEVVSGTLKERMHTMQGQEYNISVSNAAYDNRCTVWFKSGQRIDLLGDQFGVHFPSMDAADVSSVVEGYVNQQMNQEMAVNENTIGEVGDKVTLHVPEYTTVVTILQEDGNTVNIGKGKIYNERQVDVMTRAAKKLSVEEMDLVGDPRLSAAQMEQIYNGIRDGLEVERVAMYAAPGVESWQMDIYRFGMGNGIPFDNIKEVVESNAIKPTNWEDSRNMVHRMIKAQRNLIIKDLKENGLRPEVQLVKKIEHLNGLTGKMHNVKSIVAEAKGLKDVHRTSDKLKKNISDEIGHQKKMKAAAKAPEAAPVR